MNFDEFEEESKSLGDYIAVLRRRKKQLLVPAVITFVLMVLVALIWPSTYRSSATILIESQDIPADLVRSTVTSYAVQQVQETNQRATTVSNVMRLVEQYGLYADENMLRTEIVEEFRDNVKLDLVSADVVDPKSGRPVAATIAFTLSFDDGNARIAQQVTNELVNLYLSENLKSRSEKSKGATTFLSAEAEALAAELREQDQALAEFKKQHADSLPESNQYNRSLLERTEREILDINQRIRDLQRSRIQLEADLAPLSPSAPVILPTGERVLGDADRLKALQSEYREKSARYSESHPDVSRLKREIDALMAGVGNQEGMEELRKQLQTERDKLTALQGKYKEDHPEIAAQKRVIAVLETDVENVVALDVEEEADNPAYVFVKSRIDSVDTEISGLKEKQAKLRELLVKYEGFILAAPEVEKEYAELLRDQQAMQFKYAEIKAKQREAEVAQNLETERKGERFTLIDPPVFPEEPVSPNRVAILLLGFILSGAAGLGVVVLSEAMDSSIRGEKDLVSAVGMPPLVVVPYLEVAAEQRKRNQDRKYLLIGLGVSVLIFLVLVHFLFKPLDVLWFIILRELGL